MVENYTKDLKESAYHGAVVSALAVGYTVLGKTLIKMSPPSLGKFDVDDGVKSVAIVAISDFAKDYLIKQKIIPNNIKGMASIGFLTGGAFISVLAFSERKAKKQRTKGRKKVYRSKFSNATLLPSDR